MDQQVVIIDDDDDSKSETKMSSNTNTNDNKINVTSLDNKSEKVVKGTRKTNRSVKRRSTADIPMQKKPDKKRQRKSSTAQQTRTKGSAVAGDASSITSNSTDNIQSGALNIAQELAMNRNNTLNSLSPEIANIATSQSQIKDDFFQNVLKDNGFSPIPSPIPTANNISNNNIGTVIQTDNNKPMKVASLISTTVYPRQKRLLNPGNGKLEQMNNPTNVRNSNTNNSTMAAQESSISKASGSDLYLKSIQLLSHKNNPQVSNSYLNVSNHHSQSNLLSGSDVKSTVSTNSGDSPSSAVLPPSVSSPNIVDNIPSAVLTGSSSELQQNKKQTIKKSFMKKNQQSSSTDIFPSLTTTTNISDVTKSTPSHVSTSTPLSTVATGTKKTSAPRKRKVKTAKVATTSSGTTATVPIAPASTDTYLKNIVESKVKNLPTLKPKPANDSNNAITTIPNTGITINDTYIPSFQGVNKNTNSTKSDVNTSKNNLSSLSQAHLKNLTSSTTSSTNSKIKNLTTPKNSLSSSDSVVLPSSNITTKQSSKSVVSNTIKSATISTKTNKGSNTISATTSAAPSKVSHTTSVKPTEKKKVAPKSLTPSLAIEPPSLLKATSILGEPKDQLNNKTYKKSSIKEEKAIILNIPLYNASTNDYLDENGTVVVNVPDLVKKELIHNNINGKLTLEQEKLNKRNLFINNTDKISLNNNNSDVDGINSDDTVNKDSKKKAHPMKGKSQIGKYDMEDPFIDDSELLWEEQRATTKDGFFVFFGPLIEKNEVPKIERTQSSLKRSRR